MPTNQQTEETLNVEQILGDTDLLTEFLSDILLHAYLAYGGDYVNDVLEYAEYQAELHHTNQQ